MRRFIDERTIRRHIYKRNDIWWIRIQINHRKTHESLGTTDKEAAVQLGYARFGKPSSVNVARPKQTAGISRLYTLYREANPDRVPRYCLGIKKAVDLLVETLGDVPMDSVTSSDTITFRIKMLDRTRIMKGGKEVPISGATINGYMRMLRTCFHIAEEREYIPKNSNPFTKFPRTKEHTRIPKAFSPQEYSIWRKKAVEIYGEYFALLLDVYLQTGMRDEEATKILWKYIDWKLHILRLPPEHTKSDTERIIPLTSRVMGALRTLKAAGFDHPIFLAASTISHHWQFMREGTRYRGADFKGTGLDGTFHSLRKTTITKLKTIGLNQDLTDILVGHKRRNVSAEHYTDYVESLDAVRSALERLSAMYFPNSISTLVESVKVYEDVLRN